jgi:uncharacterized membrane protein YraQ (UPF0718 family)/YHS domain-containing protein
VTAVLGGIADGLENALLMAYEVWWALVLGFAISAIVQAWVPRAAIERRLAGGGAGAAAWATGLGAASSSCSYAAVAIAKSLFAKGASARSAIAFQFASTNLVWELGLVLWVLIGWQFTVGEYVGGIVLIAIMWAGLRLLIPAPLERQARRHAQAAETGHEHHMSESSGSLRERLGSASAWSAVAHNFRGDWQMVYREVAIGFLLAGFIGLVHPSVFNVLFLHDSPPLVRELENVVVGPLLAVLTFVCSVGNVPLAAVLWSGGISFAGVISFIFADLIVLPIISIYRRYYGGAFALRMTVLLFGTMALAALAVSAGFSLLGLVPEHRPTSSSVFGGVGLDYKLVLNVLATVLFCALFALTARRGARDPVCGMTVDRGTALHVRRGATTYYFCGPGCRDSFVADPQRYAGGAPPRAAAEHAHSGSGPPA